MECIPLQTLSASTLLAGPQQLLQYSNPGLALKDEKAAAPQRPSDHNLCKHLQVLSMQGTDVTETEFLQLISGCEQLLELDLSGCDSLFMSGQLLVRQDDIQRLRKTLGNLQELHLASIRHLTDASFTRITSICPNLERLSLSGARMSFLVNVSVATMQTLLTFNTVSGYLHQQADKLTSLNLSRSNLSDDALAVVVKLPGLRLRKLELVACKEITDEGVRQLCEAQPALEELNLAQCTQLTDVSLHAITEDLVNLHSLDLEQVRQITDKAASKLLSLQKLQSISLALCYGIGSKAAALGLCQTQRSCLSVLNLKCCHAIDDTFVVEMCRTLTHLKHLDLSSCSQLTDVSVHHISAHLLHLHHLNLSSCRQISDYGLLGLEQDPEYVKHAPVVRLCKCQRRENLTINLLASPLPERNYPPIDPANIDKRLMHEECIIPISNLTFLRHLDLSSCILISDISLTRAMDFSNLQVLRLDMCPLVSDEALKYIAFQNRTLEQVYASRCTLITDVGVSCLIESLPLLSTLDVSFNSNISDVSMKAVHSHSRCLTLLDVSICKNVTMEAVEMLEGKLPDLLVKKRVIHNNKGDFIFS